MLRNKISFFGKKIIFNQNNLEHFDRIYNIFYFYW